MDHGSHTTENAAAPYLTKGVNALLNEKASNAKILNNEKLYNYFILFKALGIRYTYCNTRVFKLKVFNYKIFILNLSERICYNLMQVIFFYIKLSPIVQK